MTETLGAALDRARRTLQAAGIEAPQREARLLLAEATGLSPATLMGWPERLIDPAAGPIFDRLIARRTGHEPLSRILGRREFWSLPFAITPATLDPRPDTETLVEAALRHLPGNALARPAGEGRGEGPYGRRPETNAEPGGPRPQATPSLRASPPEEGEGALGAFPRILDLGTGSGCILLALLSELADAVGVGIDRSQAAIQIARDNARALKLSDRAQFVVGDWTASIAGRFDLVVSNPPYIPTADIARLAPEVRLHDPPAALDGGADGLDAYRTLAGVLDDVLAMGGMGAFELGFGQERDVAALFEAQTFRIIERHPDLAGIPRALVVTRSS